MTAKIPGGESKNAYDGPAPLPATKRAAAPEPTTAPEPLGGDPACWLDRVCQACGRFVDNPFAEVCPACGAPRFDAGDGGLSG